MIQPKKLEDINMIRYSKKNAFKILEKWIDEISLKGFDARFKETGINLRSIDCGMYVSACDLLHEINSTKSLLKKDFRKLIDLKWEIACTLPKNKNFFTEKVGYNQVSGKSKEVCFEYGNFYFDVNVVYSIFSVYFK
jgi:hypothetical protein